MMGIMWAIVFMAAGAILTLVVLRLTAKRRKDRNGKEEVSVSSPVVAEPAAEPAPAPAAKAEPAPAISKAASTDIKPEPAPKPVEVPQPVIPEPQASASTVNIQDGNGRVVLTLELEQLLYAQSYKNDITVFYESDGKVVSKQFRCTMKLFEVHMSKYLLRCHNSFMVRTERIKDFHDVRDDMYLTLNTKTAPGKPVTVSVSRPYREEVRKVMSGI